MNSPIPQTSDFIDSSDDPGKLEILASQAHNLTLDKDSLTSLTKNLKLFFNCEAATLFSYDGSKRELHSRNFYTPQVNEIRVEISLNNLAGYVAATGNPLNIKNVRSRNELSQYNRELTYDSSWDEKLNFTTKSMIAIPLPHRNNLVGVLELINKDGDSAFSEEDFTKAKAIAPMMGFALARIEDEEKSYLQKPASGNKFKEKARQDDQLHHLSRLIHSTKSLDEIFLNFREPLMEMFNTGSATIFAVDNEKNELVSKINKNGIIKDINLPLSPENISGLAAVEQKTINITDIGNPDELKKISPSLKPHPSLAVSGNGPIKSILAMPMVQQNILMGVLQLGNKKNQEGFSAQDENNAFLVAETLAVALNNLGKAIELTPSRFGSLIEKGLVTEGELAKSLTRSRKACIDLEKLLVEELFLRAQDVGKALEQFYNVPYMGFDGSLDLPSPKQMSLKKELLLKQYWTPIKLGDREIIVLVNDPQNKEVTDAIALKFQKHRVEYRLGLKVDIHKYIERFFSDRQDMNVIDVQASSPDSVESAKENAKMLKENISPETASKNVGEIKNMVSQTETSTPPTLTTVKPAQDDSVVKLFDEIIKISGEHGVTDVHIEPDTNEKNIQVRLRKDGACRVFEKIPGQYQSQLIKHIKTISKLDLAQSKLPQNGSLVWEKGSLKLELMVVTLPTIGGAEDITIKIKSLRKPTPTYIPLDKMNFSDPNLKRIKNRISKRRGLILVAAGKGCGSTTTLHSLLGHINNSDKKILTAEDPVEIVQPGLRQMQIDNESGLNFACALKNLILSSPDVIMSGELADAETFKLALDASSEQLVLGAVVANSALETITLLRHLGIDHEALSKSLLMVVAQKLVTVLCEHCKKDYHPTREEFDNMANFYGEKYFPELGVEYKDNLMIKVPGGCKKCLFSGYGKKTAIQEVTEGTSEFNKLIAQKASMDELRKQAFKDGMIGLNQDAVYKIFKGDCDPKQVEEVFLPEDPDSAG